MSTVKHTLESTLFTKSIFHLIFLIDIKNEINKI